MTLAEYDRVRVVAQGLIDSDAADRAAINENFASRKRTLQTTGERGGWGTACSAGGSRQPPCSGARAAERRGPDGRANRDGRDRQPPCATRSAPSSPRSARWQGSRDGSGRWGSRSPKLQDETSEAEVSTAKRRCSDAAVHLKEWKLIEQASGRTGLPVLLIDAAGPAISSLTNDLLSASLRGPGPGRARDPGCEGRRRRG